VDLPDPQLLDAFLAVCQARGVKRWKFSDGSEMDLGEPVTARVAATPDPGPAKPGALDLIMQMRGLSSVG